MIKEKSTSSRLKLLSCWFPGLTINTCYTDTMRTSPTIINTRDSAIPHQSERIISLSILKHLLTEFEKVYSTLQQSTMHVNKSLKVYIFEGYLVS